MIIKQYRNNNLIAKISKNANQFNVVIKQVSNSGTKLVEDYFSCKMSISTFNRAEKWALKNIA